MPSVPRYDTEVRQAPLPNVKVSGEAPIEAFGGGEQKPYNAAVAGVAEAVRGIATEQKKNADDLATQEAWAKTVKEKNRLMFDPKEGAVNRKGKDSFGVHDEYVPRFSKFTDDIESGLANSEQQAMYHKMKLQQQADFDGDLQRHVFTERKAFEEETTKSGIAAAREDAVIHFSDPAKIQDGLNKQAAFIQDHAQKNGKSPDWVKENLLEASSKTHTGVIEQMLAGGADQAASAYYKRLPSGAFTGEDEAKIKKAIEDQSTRGESQRRSDAIVADADGMSDAVETARAIKDPKVRDATLERVKDYYATEHTAEQRDIEDLHKRATDIVDKTGTVDKIPASDWSRFTLAERSALKAYAKKTPDTDWDAYYNVKTLMAMPATKEKALQLNLFKDYRGKLADPEFKEVVGLQEALRKGDDKVLDGFRTNKEIVDDTMRSAGIDPTPKDNDLKGAKKVLDVRRAVDEEMLALQRRNGGKKATDEEMQKLVDDQVKKVVKKQSLFGIDWLWPDKVTPANEIEIDDVPVAEQQKIKEALRRKGVPVNNLSIRNLYDSVHKK